MSEELLTLLLRLTLELLEDEKKIVLVEELMDSSDWKYGRAEE